MQDNPVTCSKPQWPSRIPFPPLPSPPPVPPPFSSPAGRTDCLFAVQLSFSPVSMYSQAAACFEGQARQGAEEAGIGSECRFESILPQVHFAISSYCRGILVNLTDSTKIWFYSWLNEWMKKWITLMIIDWIMSLGNLELSSRQTPQGGRWYQILIPDLSLIWQFWGEVKWQFKTQTHDFMSHAPFPYCVYLCQITAYF